MLFRSSQSPRSKYCFPVTIAEVGAAIIYVPVGLFMLASGDTFGGLGILAYGFLVVGLVDNVFRFTFLKKLENIHPLNTVFGIILGLKIFVEQLN